MGGQAMQLSPEHEADIRRVIRSLKCPHDRPCYTNGFTTLCRAKPIGETGIVDCLESRGRFCTYGMPFGNGILCQCPLRQYLAEQRLA